MFVYVNSFEGCINTSRVRLYEDNGLIVADRSDCCCQTVYSSPHVPSIRTRNKRLVVSAFGVIYVDVCDFTGMESLCSQ